MPREVDRIFRYPRGRSLKLARKNQLAHVKLPDGEIRFDADVIQQIIKGSLSVAADEPEAVAHG